MPSSTFNEARAFWRDNKQVECSRGHKDWADADDPPDRCRKRIGNNHRKCGQPLRQLTKAETVGIGWFVCMRCDRLFAGFIRGDLTAPCFGCGRHLQPRCLSPGKSAAGRNRKTTKNGHHCSECHGGGSCPIVAEAMNV